MVNVFCYRGNFINMTFIDAKTKYRTPYLLDVWSLLTEPYKVVFRTSSQRLQKGRLMALHIGQCGDVFKTLHWEVLRTLYFNILRTLVEGVVRMLIGDVPRRLLCFTRSICFCRYYCPGLPTWLKICLDLFLISCDNILKKKDVNVQVKLTSFPFLEKDRKFGAYPER